MKCKQWDALGVFEEVVGRKFGTDFQDQGNIIERERGNSYFIY